MRRWLCSSFGFTVVAPSENELSKLTEASPLHELTIVRRKSWVPIAGVDNLQAETRQLWEEAVVRARNKIEVRLDDLCRVLIEEGEIKFNGQLLSFLSGRDGNQDEMAIDGVDAIDEVIFFSNTPTDWSGLPGNLKLTNE